MHRLHGVACMAVLSPDAALQWFLATNSLAHVPGMGSGMADWFLWDGRERQGPMDQGALGARIRATPNADLLRVWREGLDGWTTVAEALGPDHVKAPVPPPLPPPLPEAASIPELPEGRNFITRHWRGQYSLGVSYWVVGILSNLAAVFAILLASQFMLTAVPFVPLSIFIFFVVVWAWLIALAMWQTVGIWRSATRRRIARHAAGKRAFRAVVAKVAVCLGWVQLATLLVKTAIPQVAEATRMAFLGDPSIPAYTMRVLNSGTEAEITGGIKYGVTADLEKLLETSSNVRVLHLDSIGGRIGEGKKLNALIRARALDTYVEGKCLSACTLAFVAGKQRILRKGASLGFHRGAFPGSQAKDLGSDVERDIYSAAGITTAFIDKALATANSDMWRPTEAELVSAKVITKVSSGNEFAIGGVNMSREDWDKSLMKSLPVYAALKQTRPDDYSEILDIFATGGARGTPRGEVTVAAQAKLHGVIRTLLPLADDAVVIEVGKLRADEYRALQGKDVAACYKYVTAEVVDPAVLNLLPAEFGKRETAMHDQIVRTARQRDKASTKAAWDRVKSNLLARGYAASELQMFGKKVEPPLYARYCAIAIAAYEEILKLPNADAGAVLREMFAGG